MKNIITLLSLLFLFSCNEPTKNEEPKNINLNIDGFLFIKKGMKLNNVINYLNKNSIKHSELIKSNDIVDRITYLDMKYIDVFNYNLEDVVIDKIRIYFIEDHINKIYYEKQFITSNKNDDKFRESELKVVEFYKKYGNVINSIYDELEEKYGFRGTKDKIKPVNWFPTKIGECNEFDVNWDERNNKSLKSDSTLININLMNKFCYNKHEGVFPYTELEYTQIIMVNFFEEFIENKVKENQKNTERFKK